MAKSQSVDVSQLNGTLVDAQKNIVAVSENLQESITAIQSDESFAAGAAVADELSAAIQSLARASSRVDIAIKSTAPAGDTSAEGSADVKQDSEDEDEEEAQAGGADQKTK